MLAFAGVLSFLTGSPGGLEGAAASRYTSRPNWVRLFGRKSKRGGCFRNKLLESPVGAFRMEAESSDSVRAICKPLGDGDLCVKL